MKNRSIETPIPNVLIPTPPPPLPPTILCHEALYDAELLLTLPLPENPDLELLEAARSGLLAYFDWLTYQGVTPSYAEENRKEMHRAADRLLEIALAMNPLLAAQDAEKRARQERENEP